MTDQDFQVTIDSIAIYSKTISEEQKAAIREIYDYIKISKTIRLNDIPIVRMILMEVNKMYLNNLAMIDKNKTFDADTKDYFRMKMAEVNNVLKKL